MCRLGIFVLPALLVLILGCNQPTSPEKQTPGDSSSQTSSTTIQVGLNFIRVLSGEVPAFDQPAQVFADFEQLGAQMFRQMAHADLTWQNIEPHDNEWHFENADAVLLAAPQVPVVTLFSYQYASPTPPWETDPAKFQKALGPEAKDYLQHVIDRYKDHVRYWEIGNEMEHWRALDPGNEGGPQPARLPSCYPTDGFSPQEQGKFLAQVAAFIRERDPDAVILMPGLGGLDDHSLNTWFAGVLEGGGSDWFDVVNYHYYASWKPFTHLRAKLNEFLRTHSLQNKPVWCTETGSTSSATLTLRTNYPNSPQTQAADVFRRLVQAWGAGDERVFWHTHISSPDVPSNNWRCYGLRTHEGEAKPAYYTYQLLTRELLPFAKVEALSSDPEGVNHYRFTREDAGERDVVWGQGSFTVPQGSSQMTSVVPDENGQFTWVNVTPGQKIDLSDTPFLLK